MNRFVKVGAARVAALATLLSCAPEPGTQIVVRIFTDLHTEAELQGVHVVAARVLGDTIGSGTFEFPGNGLPGEVVLVAHDPRDARPVRVDVRAIFGGAELARDFTHTTLAAFEEGKTLLLDVVLARRCADPRVRAACRDGTTCGFNGCEAVERRRLPELTTSVFDPTGYPCTVCSSLCVHLDVDVANCGSCGRRCPSSPHARATCAAGRCGVVCEASYASCGGGDCDTATAEVVDGCSCERVCALPHATARCEGGRCAVAACVFPWGDCDGLPANGCETEVTTAASCGACGRSCAPPHGRPLCVADLCDDGSNCSYCQVASCDPGFGDCDLERGNGCEVELGSDPNNCGACSRRCLAPDRCRDGDCALP